MSNIISRIAFQVFALIIAIMIAIVSYFSISSYLHSVKEAETAQFNRLEGIIYTFTSYLEIKIANRFKIVPDHSGRMNETEEGTLSAALYVVTAANDIRGDLQILIIDDELNKVEILDAYGKKYADISNEFILKIIKERPRDIYKMGLGDGNYSNNIFYAYPLYLGSDNVSTYVFAYEDISDHLALAKTRFYKMTIFSLIAFVLIITLGIRALHQIVTREKEIEGKIEEQILATDEKQSELQTLLLVLQKSENLILITDNKGQIEWVNEQNIGKSNYSSDELETFVGREIAEISHYPQIKEVIKKANQIKSKIVYETKSFDDNGNEFWVQTSVTPILGKSGEVNRFVFMDNDITRLKLAEREIANLTHFTHENTYPLIRIQYDGKILFANDASKPLLHKWDTGLNRIIQKNSIFRIVKNAISNQTEKEINVDIDNRIYRLQFFPIKEKGYVNIYGEDITEVLQSKNHSQPGDLKTDPYNLSIINSVDYARKIQSAILPAEDHIRQFFKDSFVLMMPRDIVSGDFFWINEVQPREEFLLALADSSCQGIQGAMMSIMGHSLLNEIVNVEKCTDPALILEMLDTHILSILRQNNYDSTFHCLNISIVKIDLIHMTLTYAGAQQKLYLVNGDLTILKGDKNPIGGTHSNEPRKFTNHTSNISKGNALYLISKGFEKQFENNNDKNTLSAQLQSTILSNHKYSMQAQSFIFNQIFNELKGNNIQTDDVSILGIKI